MFYHQNKGKYFCKFWKQQINIVICFCFNLLFITAFLLLPKSHDITMPLCILYQQTHCIKYKATQVFFLIICVNIAVVSGFLCGPDSLRQALPPWPPQRAFPEWPCRAGWLLTSAAHGFLVGSFCRCWPLWSWEEELFIWLLEGCFWILIFIDIQ